MGTQSGGVARDLVMPAANAGRVLVVEVILKPAIGAGLGPVGVGVIRPLVGRRRTQKTREGGGAKEEGRVKERQSN